MTEKNGDSSFKKYSNDIATIKSIMAEVEKRPMIENWAFFTWAFFMFSASLIHYLGWKVWHYSHSEIFFKVWIPLIVIGCILEGVAWFKRIIKDDVPLLNRQAQVLFINIAMLSVIVIYVMYLIAGLGGAEYLPSVIMLYFAGGMVLYGNAYCNHLYAVAVFLSVTAIVLNTLTVSFGYKCISAGLITGFAFLTAGILNILISRMKHVRQ